MSQCTLARRVRFQCLHRYEVKDFSEKQNQEVFGACFSKYGHGHTYDLVGYFSGPIDKDTGMIINLKEVDEILKAATQTVSGKHLNFEVPEFSDTVPTTENLLLFLLRPIRSLLPSDGPIRLARLRLYETKDLWVEWSND